MLDNLYAAVSRIFQERQASESVDLPFSQKELEDSKKRALLHQKKQQAKTPVDPNRVPAHKTPSKDGKWEPALIDPTLISKNSRV